MKAVEVKFDPSTTVIPPAEGLARAHGKKIRSVKVIGSINLHGEKARYFPMPFLW